MQIDGWTGKHTHRLCPRLLPLIYLYRWITVTDICQDRRTISTTSSFKYVDITALTTSMLICSQLMWLGNFLMIYRNTTSSHNLIHQQVLIERSTGKVNLHQKPQHLATNNSRITGIIQQPVETLLQVYHISWEVALSVRLVSMFSARGVVRQLQ